MRTLLLMVVASIILIAGCSGGGGPDSPLVISGIFPGEVEGAKEREGIPGDRFQARIQGVENFKMLTLLVNGEVVEPEVIYWDQDIRHWVVVFTPTAEIKVGGNTVTVVEGDRQAEIGLKIVSSRQPVEIPPFVGLVRPDDCKVSPGGLVQVWMDSNLDGKQVRVLIISLSGKVDHLTLDDGLFIEGDAIKFSMPEFDGEKVLMMIKVNGEEILDYVDLFRK